MEAVKLRAFLVRRSVGGLALSIMATEADFALWPLRVARSLTTRPLLMARPPAFVCKEELLLWQLFMVYTSVLGADGKVDSDLNMNEHGIVNAHRISTDGPAPLYIGATIEAAGTNAPRLTGATDGSAAFVKADTQNTYIPVSVGTPTAESHAVTKEYSDGKTNALQASAILKSGGKMTGKLKITATPTEADDVVDKEYVDAIIHAYTAADNGKVRGVVEGKLAWVTKA